MKQISSYTPENLAKLSFLEESDRELISLLEVLFRGETNWSEVLLQVEEAPDLSVVYPCILSSIVENSTQEATLIEREVQLRLLAVILQKMGKYWNNYRSVSIPNTAAWLEGLIENPKQEIAKEEQTKQVWFHLLQLLLTAQDNLNQMTTYNLIQAGIKQEITMIVAMLAPQERKVFAAHEQWESTRLMFRKIQEDDKALLQDHFTPAVGKYLSIDALNHPVLVQAYIQQSQVEMQQGTCLVLMAFERETNVFVGCLTLNDINLVTAEIGLWVSEAQQGKGYGKELLNQAIAIIETSIPTNEIIYTVEKENHISIALCENMGFQLERELILEPTPLKNKYREMLRYGKTVTKRQ